MTKKINEASIYSRSTNNDSRVNVAEKDTTTKQITVRDVSNDFKSVTIDGVEHLLVKPEALGQLRKELEEKKKVINTLQTYIKRLEGHVAVNTKSIDALSKQLASMRRWSDYE